MNEIFALEIPYTFTGTHTNFEQKRWPYRFCTDRHKLNTITEADTFYPGLMPPGSILTSFRLLADLRTQEKTASSTP